MVALIITLIADAHGVDWRHLKRLLYASLLLPVASIAWIYWPLKGNFRSRSFSNKHAELPPASLTELFSFIPDIVCTLDANTRIRQISANAKSLLQYELAELTDRLVVELIAPGDVEQGVWNLHQLIDKKATAPFELRLRRKDGLLIDTLWSGRAYDAEDTTVCVIRDISARKATERLLQESEMRNRLVIESIPTALLITQLDGTIEFFNYSAARMFDLSLTKSTNLQDHFKDAREKHLLTKCDGHANEWMAKTETSLFPVEIGIRPFQSTDGERLLATVTDVSATKEMERLKSEFVAMLGHELRTPLMALQAFLKLLDSGVYGHLSLDGVKRVKSARSTLLNLNRLINEFLDSEKIDALSFDLDLQEVDLGRIVHDSAQTIADLASARQILVEVSATSLPVKADHERLCQVIVNLLSNALRFSKAGDSIKLSMVKNADEVEVSIQDQGPGVAPDQQSLIFQKFVQLPGQQARAGTGLGLSICKAIIEQHHGVIGVESQPGKGCRFWFRLPLTASAMSKLRG